MTPKTPAQQLAGYERRYQELAEQLAGIGLISQASVTRPFTYCASPGCRCHGDPPQPHSP